MRAYELGPHNLPPGAFALLEKRKAKTKQMNRERTKRLKAKHREFIQRVKMKKGCTHCGYNKYHGALHFHHIEPKGTGGRAVYPQWSITKIKREMRKCIILCANCHAEEHAK